MSDLALRIKGLHARVGGKPVLNGVDLSLRAGETHVLLGPNGSGKSTLAAALSADPSVEARAEELALNGDDANAMDARGRALAGLFLGFQHPVEIPGLTNQNMLKAGVNAQRAARGLAPLDVLDFIDLARQACKSAGAPESFLTRDVNAGMSGGEKKRNELVQMILLDPSIILLDEIDSGLDIDAIDDVARVLREQQERGKTLLLITHYQKLLSKVRVDRAHVLIKGRIAQSGGPELIEQIQQEGYGRWQD